MKTSLYNNDGTLSAQAQSLLSPKPDDMSIGEWKKRLKEFRTTLSPEEVIQFQKLRRKQTDLLIRRRHYVRIRQREDSYRANGGEVHKIRHIKYCLTHRSKNKKKYNEREKRRRTKDPIVRFYCSLRTHCTRVVKQLSLGKKPTNTFKWVGCSPEELKDRFEFLFVEGMTWENYGEWHVDHIRPVSSFAPEEWKQINHYTNLQPLWAQDNYEKGAEWNNGDLSTDLSDNIRTVEEVQETRGTQKENNRSTGCQTP